MIRHYHQVGVLPEPARGANGYRRYRVRDVAVVLRVRSLVELGMSLAEVRDVLADTKGRNLREILEELDADLAAEQERLSARRRRLAALIDAQDQHGGPSAKAEVLSLLRDIGHPALEREQFVADLIETSVEPELSARVWDAQRQVLQDPATARAVARMEQKFQVLADKDADDPLVDEIVREADEFGEVLWGMLPGDVREGPGDPSAADRLLTSLGAGMGPAQRRCLELMFATWRERSS